MSIIKDNQENSVNGYNYDNRNFRADSKWTGIIWVVIIIIIMGTSANIAQIMFDWITSEKVEEIMP